jgi:CRP/FNR family cyclic AMP-dependent transcriptional regulator
MLIQSIPQVKEVIELAFNASRKDIGVNTTSQSAGKTTVRRTKRKRRTKGPSEKIRSLAAFSLAPKVGYLKLSDLLGSENHETGASIVASLSKKRYRQGDTIYPATRNEPMLFLVKSGSVNIVRPSLLGSEFNIKRIGPGTLFGEMAQLGQSMLGAHAKAAETSEIAFIKEGDFERIASAAPEAVMNLLRQLGHKLVEAEKSHEQAAFQTVKARVAAMLMKLATKGNQVLGLTHQDIADMLGVYRETVTNAIAELKQDGLIEVGRKRIGLLDLPGLQKLVSF